MVGINLVNAEALREDHFNKLLNKFKTIKSIKIPSKLLNQNNCQQATTFEE